MDVDFKIKTYGVKELALLYLPQLGLKSAVNQFRIWINNSPNLKQELIDNGYKAKQKLYTPKQVELFVKYLGTP